MNYTNREADGWELLPRKRYFNTSVFYLFNNSSLARKFLAEGPLKTSDAEGQSSLTM